MKDAVATEPNCKNSFRLIKGPLPPLPTGEEIKKLFLIFFSDFISIF